MANSGEIQQMPTLEEMTKKDYTFKEWLQFYHNLWRQIVIARTVDVQFDTAMKAKNPETAVLNAERTGYIPVKQRLEAGKESLEDGLFLLKQIEYLQTLDDEALAKKYWTEEALALAPDMIPPENKVEAAKVEPKVGDACLTAENIKGTLQQGADGLVCVADAAPAAATNVDAAAPEKPADAPVAPATVEPAPNSAAS